MSHEFHGQFPHGTGVTYSRRQALAASVAVVALAATGGAFAQDLPPEPAAAAAPDPVAATPPAPEPFSFDILTERMRKASQEPYRPTPPVEGFPAQISYDDFRNIRFLPERARWAAPGAPFTLQAFHLGWLFKQPVEMHEVVDGMVQDFGFSTDDFLYENGMADRVPPGFVMPGVAGFRIHAPFNRRGVYDEVIAFLGASYFRALGRGNTYGLSARGLAVNTAMGGEEEFPRFSAFWLERPAPGDDRLTFYASLQSPSVAGAYRFVLAPGEETRVDVTARLFFRASIQQPGIAPLTSMFLFGPTDHGPFDDYRRQVHDSELLMIETDTERSVRPLNNPPRLGNSYFNVVSPRAFGLIQRSRNFDDYLDAGAHYERRPSLIVEPLGDWGEGMVRLIEIPSDLESNDNIVVFWVPGAKVSAGDVLEYAYRLHWGTTPIRDDLQFARVVRTLAGNAGISGAKPNPNVRKFAVDFEGGELPELSRDSAVEGRVNAANGNVIESTVTRIDGTDTWRLVFETEAAPGAVVELKGALFLGDRQISETWLYQWMKE
ncbi:glucan biosynthesis protein [Tropicimonas sp. IMCC34043]|uniref:glucan biosynthesis protein n=1 Tax=Tropicimonas sp. IMCC34043 TaxID=2248760 RepID=UPI000E236ECE|nr:glucan biosynthesis protein G [Tropicimonas sp. IMCC34043]